MNSSRQSKIGTDAMKDFKVLQMDGGGDESDFEECSETEVAAGGGDSHSDESTHNLTLSDTLDDGSIKLREEGALFKENSFLNLTENSLPSLNSSILLSDKIGLSINEIETDDEMLPLM